ncbi:unnamed protein product [Cuscuta campestris]|uniref:Ty3 transposon capsid-like protein domain-containing protein n=1 Tax=Cuscuta campestris TaxID=132261 RepID=A0A484L9C8_9ASTE|nr:unnamed protein product [Cuscuta campestris]
MATIEEALKALVDQKKVFAIQMEQQNRKIEDQQAMFRQIMEQIKSIAQGESTSTPGSKRNQERRSESDNPRQLHFNPKVEFPQFDGSNVRNWIKKCVKYFMLCRIPEEKKVDLASLYMTGKAEMWYSSYTIGRNNIMLEDFVVDLCARFKDELGSKLVEEFNKLQQGGNLEEYVDKFEELKSCMLMKNPLLPPKHMLDSFIGGLKPHLKAYVRAFKPESLAEAIEYTRCQEETVQAIKVQDRISKPVFNSNKALLPTPNSAKPVNSLPVANQPKFIPAAGEKRLSHGTQNLKWKKRDL